MPVMFIGTFDQINLNGYMANSKLFLEVLVHGWDQKRDQRPRYSAHEGSAKFVRWSTTTLVFRPLALLAKN